MRMIAVVAILFGVFSVFIHEARADGTWCARYPGGASNCGFYSFEQCQATVSGIGGFCDRNPFTGYAGTAQRRYRRDR